MPLQGPMALGLFRVWALTLYPKPETGISGPDVGIMHELHCQEGLHPSHALMVPLA